MDWIQLLREFGVPTLYAVVMLAYFFRVQDFLRKETLTQITEIKEHVTLIDDVIKRTSDIQAETTAFRENSKECMAIIVQKSDQILTGLIGQQDDLKTLGTVTQSQIEVLSNISERIRDIFSYFIDLLKRGEAK